MARPSTSSCSRGQALVEFALIFPIFVVLLLSIIEFMFLFNAQLSLNYATRDAALVAAEAGVRLEADCLILQQIDKDMNPPADESRVLTVHIFSATETGGQLSTPTEQTYTRILGGDVSTSCDASGTPSMTAPYTLVSSGYPAANRCSDLDRTACSSALTALNPTNTGVDIIGVKIDYGYRFITPLGSAFSLIGNGAPLWGGAGMTMTVGNAMRMEPIL